MWCHEHFNLNGPPDVVTFSKKMQLGGYYHKPDFKYVFVNVTKEFSRLMYYNLCCWDCSVMADLLSFLIWFFNKTFTTEREVMWLWNKSANHWTFHCFYFTVYEGLPKISENLLVITWILTLSPNFHRHLRSSCLGLVYNDPSDFATFGSTHWSLPALACLVSVAILLGPLQWRRNVALSTRVSL